MPDLSRTVTFGDRSVSLWGGDGERNPDRLPVVLDTVRAGAPNARWWGGVAPMVVAIAGESNLAYIEDDELADELARSAERAAGRALPDAEAAAIANLERLWAEQPNLRLGQLLLQLGRGMPRAIGRMSDSDLAQVKR